MRTKLTPEERKEVRRQQKAANYIQNRERRRQQNAVWRATHKESQREYLSKWHAEHKGTQKAAMHAWYLAHKGTVKARSAEYYRANREAIIAQVQDRYYGVQDSMAKRAEIFLNQGGRCALCNQLVSLKKGEDGLPVAHLDHDHATGALRGILCPQCNAALGCFNDDVAVLQRAVDYLRRHKEATCSVSSMKVS